MEGTEYNSSVLELEGLFGALLEKGGSDLFLTAGKPPILKINKEFLELSGAAVLSGSSIQALLGSMLDEERLKKFEEEKVLDFAYDHKDIARFRVNTYRQKGNTSLAFRYIPKQIPSFEDLHLPSTIKSFATINRGLVLFVSPKNSGKTTTIASLIDFMNHTQQKHIITIEHPIEYVYQSDRSICEQQEVGVDIHTQTQALESVVHSGADVVQVNKMDSPEVVEKTIHAAESGHLVFATLNTSYAAETINWVVDLFPVNRQGEIRTRLSAVLSGIVTQQLVPAVDETLRPATEILIVNPAVRNLIREGKTYQIDDAIATGMAEGMLTLDRSLVELVKSGTVAKEVALNHVRDIATFESLLQA